MARRRILIVEDDDAIRQLLMQYLQEHSGVIVAGARDGADALHEVGTRSYDAVLLDLMMPYMTGIDFLESLQVLASTDSGKHLDTLPPVIVITAASPEQIPTDTLTGRFSGIVRAVLRKPVDTCELGRQVEAVLGNEN